MVEREHCSVEFAKCVVLDFTGNSEKWSVVCAVARPQCTAPYHVLERNAISKVKLYVTRFARVSIIRVARQTQRTAPFQIIINDTFT